MGNGWMCGLASSALRSFNSKMKHPFRYERVFLQQNYTQRQSSCRNANVCTTPSIVNLHRADAVARLSAQNAAHHGGGTARDSHPTSLHHVCPRPARPLCHGRRKSRRSVKYIELSWLTKYSISCFLHLVKPSREILTGEVPAAPVPLDAGGRGCYILYHIRCKSGLSAPADGRLI